MQLKNGKFTINLAKKISKKIAVSLVILALFFELGLPGPAVAAEESYAQVRTAGLGLLVLLESRSQDKILARNEKLTMPSQGGREFLPLEDEEPQVTSERWITASAYSSTRDQTDGSPFMTAWQTPVRDGIVAANFLPKGAMVKFPDLYGDKIFIVEDRMNARYQYRVDIWMPTRQEAIQFGLKYVRLQILDARVDRDYVLNKFAPHQEAKLSLGE